MKILWANFACLLDSSSGASLSVRQILMGCQNQGHDVRILGTATFDDEKGLSLFGDSWSKIYSRNEGEFIDVNDGSLTHQILITKSLNRDDITVKELTKWTSKYCHEIKYFKPDFIFFYGTGPGDVIPSIAKKFGVPCGAYLVNGSFNSLRWCQDIDTFITDTSATRDLYRKRLNIDPIPIGKFIEDEKVSKTHTRKSLLYINPTVEKGAIIFLILADILFELNPNLKIQIVQSRGNWAELLAAVNKILGRDVNYLSPNIEILSNTADMASVYRDAKFLIVPSVWWESGARVIAEAHLNGIPVIATDHGGNREMVGDGGVLFQLPSTCYEEPYTTVPTARSITPLAEKIVELNGDEKQYWRLSQNALKNAYQKFDKKKNVEIFIEHVHSIIKSKTPWRVKSEQSFSYKQYQKLRGLNDLNVFEPLEKNSAGIFIDIFGGDGSASVKFISENQCFDSVTIEFNGSFYPLYEHVPTKLWSLKTSSELNFGSGNGFNYYNTLFSDYWNEIVNLSRMYQKVILKLNADENLFEALSKICESRIFEQDITIYVDWKDYSSREKFEIFANLLSKSNYKKNIKHMNSSDFLVGSSQQRHERRMKFLENVFDCGLDGYQFLRTEEM